MSNRFRGEAELKVGEKTLTIVLDINAMIMAEDVLDTDLKTLLGIVGGRIKLGVLRGLLWAGLQHLDEPPNLLRAGELIAEAGAPTVRAAILKALVGAMPTPERKAVDDDRPPKAAGGNGNGSSVAGAAPVESLTPSGG